MPRVRLLALLFTALVVHSGRPAPAQACSIAGPSAFVAASPASGPIVVSVYCPILACIQGEMQNFSVVDMATGEPVAGEVLQVSGKVSTWIEWRPDTPLAVGSSYEIGWQPGTDFPLAGEKVEFQASADESWTADDVELGADLSLVSYLAEPVGCPAAYRDSCNNETADVPLKEYRHAGLELSLPEGGASAKRGPLLEFRSAFWSADEAEPELSDWSWPFQGAGREFDRAASRYCYRVELRNVIDASTDVREGCFEHGSLGEVGDFDRSTEELSQALAVCARPPEGLEQAWCDGQREACRNEPRTASCELVEHCTEEGFDAGEPDYPRDAGEPDRPSARDAGPHPVDHDAGVQPDDDSQPATGGSTGCSVLALGARSPNAAISAALLALLATIVGLRLRRRGITGARARRWEPRARR